ncbi:MAG: hypothetical protein KGV44_15015 [Flavobacteriaceae bacterium]|nr:hypothetical protein [Flavobacteriaceae bacterium]
MRDWVEVSPELTNLDKWILVTIFNIIKNPFLGDEIAVKDTLGNVFFGEQMYFRKARKVK